MSRTDEILNELESGQPIEEVRAKFSGTKGPFYAALARATETAVGKFEDARAELQEINTRTAQGRETLKDLGRDTKAEENRNAEIHRANQEASHILGETRRQLEAKRKLLAKFRKVGLKPTEGLELLGKAKNLKLMVASLSEAATEKEKELTNLEGQIPAVRENYLGWQQRRDAEKRKVWDLVSQVSQLSKQTWQLTQYVERLKGEATTLDGKCSAMSQTKDELASEVRALRQKRPKLIFINEGLSADIVAQRVELARLVQVSETMAANIVSFGQKIEEVLRVEHAREAGVDKKFAERIAVLSMAYDKFIEQGEAEVERKLREIAGDGMARLPFIMERVEVGRLELAALGTQKGELIAEIRTLEERKVAFKNSVPGLMAVGVEQRSK